MSRTPTQLLEKIELEVRRHLTFMLRRKDHARGNTLPRKIATARVETCDAMLCILEDIRKELEADGTCNSPTKL